MIVYLHYEPYFRFVLVDTGLFWSKDGDSSPFDYLVTVYQTFWDDDEEMKLGHFIDTGNSTES